MAEQSEEDRVSCPVCFEPYRRPQSMKCGHILCTPCIDQILLRNQDELVQCAICRTVSHRNDLRRDFTMEELVENFLVKQKRRNEPSEKSASHTVESVSEESSNQGEIHIGIFCDGCGGDIYGSRFKCTVCPDYDLCSECERKGKHEHHSMTRIRNVNNSSAAEDCNREQRPSSNREQRPSSNREQRPSSNREQRPSSGESAVAQTLHLGITCDFCVGAIFGSRFKCLVCCDYDLCTMCERKGVHDQHVMWRIRNAGTSTTHGRQTKCTPRPMNNGVIHPGVICDICTRAIYGSRFKCSICPNYDLCSVCEHKGKHGEHRMIRMINATNNCAAAAADQASREPFIHTGVTCDRCNGSVFGSRFKCLVCSDFDLCTMCERTGEHSQHRMLRISNPANRSAPESIHHTRSTPSPSNEGAIHPGVTCDACHSRIYGSRFKCLTCPDYDLCTICEHDAEHTHHPMTRFRTQHNQKQTSKLS